MVGGDQSIPQAECILVRGILWSPLRKCLRYLSGVMVGGMYVFQLFDYYAASGVCLLWVAFFECFVIAWIYGGDNLYDGIEDMIGYRPGPWMKYSWAVITPALCVGCFVFSLVKYVPLTYNKVYRYPDWAIGLGWGLALSSMLCIPLVIVILLCRTEGPLRVRIKYLITPREPNRWGRQREGEGKFRSVEAISTEVRSVLQSCPMSASEPGEGTTPSPQPPLGPTVPS